MPVIEIVNGNSEHSHTCPLFSSSEPILFDHNHSNVRPSLTVRFQNCGVSSIPVGKDLPVDYDNWHPKRDPKSLKGLESSSIRRRFMDFMASVTLAPNPSNFSTGFTKPAALFGRFFPLFHLEGELMKRDPLILDRDMDLVNFSTVSDIKDPLIAEAAKRLSSDGGLKD